IRSLNWGIVAFAPARPHSPVPSEAWAMLGRTDLEASTCWDFPSQSDGHLKAGDATFNGVTPARCAENLVRRYARPGDLVVDPMDTVVLVRHHDRSASPMWEHRARRFNFYLRGFKYLFILQKPVGTSGG